MSRPLAVTQQQVLDTAHLTPTEAAKAIGVTFHTIQNARERYMPTPLSRAEWKKLRSVEGLTQAEAAKRLGISTHVFRKLALRASSQVSPFGMPWWKRLFVRSFKRRQPRSVVESNPEVTSTAVSQKVAPIQDTNQAQPLNADDAPLVVDLRAERAAARETERQEILAREAAQKKAKREAQKFDAAPYAALVDRAASAFLIDSHYAVHIAQASSRLVAKRREKEGLPPLRRPE